MAELDYVDDLELLEDYDLREGESDFSSDGDGRGRIRDNDGEASSDHDDEAESKALMNIVIGLCSALGGPEDIVRDNGKRETFYRPGDDCLGCLRDLRKLWKHDDEDLARRVAHAYSVVNVLHNDLVPIVLTCAGTGERGDKLALAATDLITALTWPLDVLDEMRHVMEKELDETKLTTLPELQRAQVDYKSSILRLRGGPSGTAERDFLSTVMEFVLLPSLSKAKANRSERDLGTINMCLHLFRNLLAIKDPVATTLASSGLVDLSTLQSKLVLAMDKSKVLDTFLMLASSAERRDYEDWNAITAECIYHLVVGTNVTALFENIRDQASRAANIKPADKVISVAAKHLTDRNKTALLTSLLAEASQKRADVVASASSRHSRFGTTISFVASDGHRGVARQASSLRKSVSELEAEEKARTRRRRGTQRVLNEKGAPGYRSGWSKAAQKVIIRWSDAFVKQGLESLSRTIIEDMRREREKLGDLDVARVHFMQLATFYLEYFLLRRATSSSTKIWDPNAPQRPIAVNDESPDSGSRVLEGESSDRPVQGEDGVDSNAEAWPMSTVSFFADKWPFALAYRRTKEALNEKNWLELATAIRLWIVMLKIMEAQEGSIDEEERNGAEWVQANVHNDNDVHETARAVMVCYKRQTFAFLDTLVHFACAYPRSLERFMKGRESMLVRAKIRVRKQMRQDGEHDGDEEEVEKRAHNIIEDAYKERVFTFNAFQDKLSTRFLADSCLQYVIRWPEFTNTTEQLDTVVRVMHRIAIKGNGRRMFYQAHQRAGFAILMTQMSVLETLAPKPAGNLKQLIQVVQRSWAKLPPEEQAKFAEGKRAPRQLKTAAPPRDIEVKGSHTVEEKMGIVVGLLLEKNHMSYVNWVKSALEHASAQRREIILNTDGRNALEFDDEGQLNHPSKDAYDKFERYVLPFPDEDQQLKKDAASLPALKLFFKLLGLEREELSEDECVVAIPTGVLPEHLDSDIALIEKYIRSPFDTGGDAFSTFVQNVRKERERKLQEPLPPENLDGFLAPDSSDNESSDGDFDVKQIRKRRRRVHSSASEEGDSSPAEAALSDGNKDDGDDDGVNVHRRALQRLIARKQRKKDRREQKAAEREEKTKRRKLSKKIYRPGDDGSRRRKVAKRHMKASAMPLFLGLEAALDDRIEDSDEELAELDRAIAANAGTDAEEGGAAALEQIVS